MRRRYQSGIGLPKARRRYISMPTTKLDVNWESAAAAAGAAQKRVILSHPTRGSTCTVYQCVERGSRKPWAVKVIQKKENRKFVISEIGILLTLSHPNVIRMREVYETPMVMYMVLELVTGGELFDRIVDRGYYSEKDAAGCVTQILEGIKYLHEHDVVHRDIKPENLLYENDREDSVLKIADFGLAKISNTQVLLQTVCGTPGYCAPEVLKEVKYSKAVDMWAVGVVVYILLCGYEPFYDKVEVHIFRKILKCEFKFHQEWWTDVSDNAKDLIRHLLVLHPSRRLTAAQALQHPWVQGCAAKTTPLKAAQTQMKEFNARRRLRMITRAVMAFKIKKLSDMTEEAVAHDIGANVGQSSDIDVPTASGSQDTPSSSKQ